VPELTLPGIRSDSLLGYLKGLGLLAIVGRQDDPQAAGAWSPAGFALHSRHDLASLETFLLEGWAPLPVVSPWNGGSGFYSSRKTDAFAVIETSDDPRLAPMRRAIAAAREMIRAQGLTARPDTKTEKPAFIRALRAVLPDDALEWLDAAIVEIDGRLHLPPLLGQGGNDGNYDIADNYARCVKDLFGRPGGVNRAALLRAALIGTGTALHRMKLAHFRRDTSPVSSLRGEADALGNPWDLVMAVNGAVLFAPAAARHLSRGQPNGDGTMVAPFAVNPTAAGYGSVAADEDCLAELWMPTWSRPARLPEVRAVLREGRMQVRRRDAATGADAARAARELGVARGITSFRRYAILKRAGKNYVSVPAGRIEVSPSPAATALATLDPWLGQVVRFALSKNRSHAVPQSVRAAIRALEQAAFRLASDGAPASAERMVCAIGNAELACSLSSVKDVRPLRSASALPWCELLDTALAETRLAIAFASLRDADRKPLRPAEEKQAGSKDQSSTPLTMREALVGPIHEYAPMGRWASSRQAPILSQLAAIHERRMLGGSGGSGGFASGLPARLDDLERLATGELNVRRLAALLRGLVVLDWSAVKWRSDPGPVVIRDPLLAHLLLAFHDPRADDEARIVPRADWIARLRGGRVRDVVDAVHLRLRLGGFAPIATPADLAESAVTADGERLAAALLLRPAIRTLHAVIGAITTYDEREVPVAP